MAFPFLPKMDAEGVVRPTVPNAGIWYRNTADTLDIIARATAAGTGAQRHNATSIPSIWGHAWFFQRAWSDPGHDSHLYLTEMWRRFIFLVALRHVLPPSLRVSLMTDSSAASGC